MYNDLILALYKNPKHYGRLSESITHRGEGENKSCGDTVYIEAVIKKGKITKIQFTGESCAISRASTSLLLEYAQGKTVADLMKLDRTFMQNLIEIPISAGRIKCLLLPLDALHHTISQK